MRLRVGAVNYLNTKPLVEGLTTFAPNIDLSFDLPSRLADQLQAQQIDVGLIPVVEFFRGANYRFIPDVGIGCRGPVLSVTLFSRVPWAEIRSVALDEGSRTSAALTRILLEVRHGLRPKMVPLPIDMSADAFDTDAVLLIGDRAMHACLPGYQFSYDLGQEWVEWTGLPMVFAVWAVRPGVELGAAEAAFAQARDFGLSRAGAIAMREAPLLRLDPGYCRRYFDTIIHYHLGPRELAGMDHYHRLAASIGLAPQPSENAHERFHRPNLESRSGRAPALV
ncbi:MAG: menaquinone biosynthetic enzyme MqnA/MqnD family protein [Gemmataceae bacterium]